jgi:DnaJ family protein C protein 2
MVLCLYVAKMNELNEQLEDEKRKQLEQIRQSQSNASGAGDKSKSKDTWSELEIQTLIKAVNLFPAGTNARYEMNISSDSRCSE